MSTHTPGPWAVDPMKIGTLWAIYSKDCQVAQADQVPNDSMKQSIRSANACLIAAAPDLLAALKALSYTCGGKDGYCYCPMQDGNAAHHKHGTACSDARAAIAKAQE